MSDRLHAPARPSTGFGKGRLVALLVATVTLWLLASPLTAQAVTIPLDAATVGTASAVQGATAGLLADRFPGKLPERPWFDDMFGDSSSVCGSNNTAAASAASNLLTVNRWGGVASRHTRQSTWSQITNYGTSTTTMGAYSAGNAFWQASAAITSWASRLCFADTMGTMADRWVAAVGNSIMGSSLLMILILAGLVGVIARRRSLRGALRVGLAAAVLVVMVAGATRTTATSYGMGSPGWITNIINRVVSSAASGPAAAMNGFVVEANKTSATNDGFGQFSCSRYVTNLGTQYSAQYATADFSSIIPASIDSMWQRTGATTYIAIQFGDNNKYGAKVYCRMLDVQAGVPSSDSLSLTQQAAWGSPTTNGLADTSLSAAGYPFAVGSDNDHTDRAMIAWAACTVSSDGKISVDPEWAKVLPDTALEDCKHFFDNSFVLDGSSAFNWDDNTAAIAAAETKSPAVADFLYSLHGDRSSGSAATAAIVYAIASFLAMLVFGVFSIAVVIAKIGMIGVTFMLLFSAMQWIVVDNGDSSPVMKTLAQYVSLTMLAFGANLILSIITVMSKGITDFGTAIGSGTIQPILAAGIAPIAATLMVHLFFTKGLKAPSPFKLTSAIDYAKRAGDGSLMTDVADAAGAKLSRGRSMARQAGGQLVNRIRRSGSVPLGGSSGRSGAMGPLSAALGGAVGGAVAEKMHDHREDQEAAADDKDVLATRSTAPAAPGRRGILGAHEDRLDDPKSKLTPKQAAMWAQTGYLPTDSEGRRVAAAAKMARLSVADRAKAASSYFAKNRERLQSGGIKAGAAAVGGVGVFAAGAVLSAPVALPAAVALGAYAAVKTTRTLRAANRDIGQIHRESAQQLETDALKAYRSGPRRALVEKAPAPGSQKTPAAPSSSGPKRDVLVELPAAGIAYRLSPAEETLLMPEAQTTTIPATPVPAGERTA